LTVTAGDGARLAVTVSGHRGPGRPTALLAHGWAAAGEIWTPVTKTLLAKGFQVVYFDQRGHGESTLGREPVSIRLLGDDLAAVAAAAEVSDAVLVGHSGGGFAALAYAAAHRADALRRLRGLVLLATAAHGQQTSGGEVRMMGSAVFSWALRRRRLGRALLSGTMGKRPDPAVRELNRRLFAATPRQVRAAYFASSRGMDLRAALAGVDLPTLVLAGSADTVVNPSLGQALAAALPQSSFAFVEAAGHMLPLERPSEVVKAIEHLS
jgi:pimeloyl-ACP methyl ester carboxylesterase